MTIVLLVAGLAFAVGLLVLRPFAVAWPGGARRAAACRVPGPADDQRRELLRQLRDLDDDLAAGKLSGDDHERLRRPVERAAAAVLTSAAKASTAKGSSGRRAPPAVAVAVAAPAVPPPGLRRRQSNGALAPPERHPADRRRGRGRRHGPA